MAVEKKVLILHASAGHGHEKAAKAVEAAAREKNARGVTLVDALAFTSWGFGRRYRSLYFFMIRRVPWLWGLFYYLTDLPWVYVFVRPMRRLTNHFFAAKLERFLLAESPDVVVSTHFLGTEMVSHLKRCGRLKSRLITVVTDYRPHTFWITPETDVYAVATEDTAREMERRGVAPGKVRVTGIPAEPKFSKPFSREALLEKLGLERSVFTVLVTSGGGGVGLVAPLVERLMIAEPPVQLLVICGTNRQLQTELEAKHAGKRQLHLYGFVENVHELMAVSDLVVGKGGGLTITESLCMERPMVLIGAVPGQESRNVHQMVARKAAKLARTLSEALAEIAAYRQDAALYEEAVLAIKKIRRPQAAEEVWRIANE